MDSDLSVPSSSFGTSFNLMLTTKKKFRSSVVPVVPGGNALIPNFIDCAVVREANFLRSTLLSSIWSRNLDIVPIVNPVTDGRALAVVYLVCSGEAEIVLEESERNTGYREEVIHQALATLNVLASGLTDEEVLNQAQSRTRFRLCAIRVLVSELRGNPAHVHGITGIPEVPPAGVIDAVPLLGHRADLRTLAQGTAAELRDRLLVEARFPNGLLMWMLLAIIDHERCPVDFKRPGGLLYATAYLALSKRGHISDKKLDSVSAAMSEETRIRIQIRADAVKLVYQAIGPKINSENAEQFFRTWSENMNDLSMRLRIRAEQAAGSGLTAYTTIREAIEMYPTFNWARVLQFCPDEGIAFLNAVNVIGFNQYYGFNQNIAAVASTRYKTLAYTAKELLLRYGGPAYDNLREYKGWTQSPARGRDIDELIMAFQPTEGEANAQNDVVNNIRGAIQAARNNLAA